MAVHIFHFYMTDGFEMVIRLELGTSHDKNNNDYGNQVFFILIIDIWDISDKMIPPYCLLLRLASDVYIYSTNREEKVMHS